MIMNRLRSGHTFLTHSYLMAKERRTRCKYCDDFLSLVHIFTCEELPEKSYNIYLVDQNGMRTFFDATKFSTIKDFLKKNDYYVIIISSNIIVFCIQFIFFNSSKFVLFLLISQTMFGLEVGTLHFK